MEIWHPAGALASWTQPRGGSFRLDLLHAIMNCLPIFHDWYRHGVLSIRFDYWLAMMSCSPRGNQFCTLDIVYVTAKTNRLEGCAAGALRAYAVAVMRLGACDRLGAGCQHRPRLAEGPAPVFAAVFHQISAFRQEGRRRYRACISIVAGLPYETENHIPDATSTIINACTRVWVTELRPRRGPR
jgi:hypothetical protein